MAGMPGEPALPYLAFLEEIRRRATGDEDWSDVAAGLSALRVIEGWLDGASAHSWGVDASQSLVHNLGDEYSAKVWLKQLLSIALSPFSFEARNRAIRAMWKYARCLEFEGDWLRAMAVYEAVLHRLSPAQRRRRTICLIRLGVCYKWTTNLRSASRAFRHARRNARSGGDIVGVLRAQMGLAEIALVRGNLLLADRKFKRVAVRAKRQGMRAVFGRALHGRATVECLSGRLEAAVSLAYRALKLTRDLEQRNRIWWDLGSALIQMGRDELARDVFEVLAVHTKQALVRWAALYSLMDVESRLGNLPEVQRYQRMLLAMRMSPYQRVHLFLTLGEAYDRNGHADIAREHLQHGLALAVEHGISQAVIDAENSLRTIARPIPHRSSADAEAFSDIAKDIRAMKADARK